MQHRYRYSLTNFCYVSGSYLWFSWNDCTNVRLCNLAKKDQMHIMYYFLMSCTLGFTAYMQPQEVYICAIIWKSAWHSICTCILLLMCFWQFLAGNITVLAGNITFRTKCQVWTNLSQYIQEWYDQMRID